MKRFLTLAGIGTLAALGATLSPAFPLLVTASVVIPICAAIVAVSIAHDIRTAR
jgi:hypothetical protein